MKPNFNIVTGIYYSSRDDVHGGRGWDFHYYKPVIYAMTKLTCGIITIYHDAVQEPLIKEFIEENNITNIVTKHIELKELPYSDKIYDLKKEALDSNLIEINGIFHLFLLNKLWFIEQTVKDLNLSDDDPITWIDAGLFHHALFPETVGGVELARFNLDNYYPINKESKFTPEFGLKIQKSLTSDKVLVFGNERISLPINWPPSVCDVKPTVYIVGGMFGGKVSAIKKLSSKFYNFLETLIYHKVLSWEEGILSKLYTDNPDDFKLATFETWYHDVPGVPNYFEGVFLDDPTILSFYRKYFQALENDEFTDKPSGILEVIRQGVTSVGQELKYGKYENLPNIAIYGSHNASFAIEHNGEILEVVELERLLNVKNAGYAQYLYSVSRKYIGSIIVNYFKEKYGFEEYGYCLHQHTSTYEDGELIHYWKHIPAREYAEFFHHESHAAGSFYQSNYQEAIVISFDGGGNDGKFKIFKMIRGERPELIKNLNLDLGFPYMIFGQYLGDIRIEPFLSEANLVYAGKILGLQSYGTVRSEWLEHFKNFYLSAPTGMDYEQKIEVLGNKIDVEFDIENRMTGSIAYDIAATSQVAFEELFFEQVDDVITSYESLPICLTGGCALNIVLNTKVKTRYNRPVFVGPAPNDAGLTVGMLANLVRPSTPIDITYGGVGILDKNVLPELIEKYNAKLTSLKNLSSLLHDGKIVGVVNGNSEHGPRALGNRSILCNPSIPGMKDILNEKVKNREWYRPFAPVVRLEDVGKYFNWEGETRWMSFCPSVKDEWRETLSAITHVDGTARVQTVTREQNQWLYDLLTEFEKSSGIGVLLNTSFNRAGKPILSTYRDAVQVFQNTQLDHLYLDGYLFTDKHRVEIWK